MKRTIIISVGLLLAVFISATCAWAQVTAFGDSFESGTLNLWTGLNGGAFSGQIVSDPLDPNNHVLTFTSVSAGGDIFSAMPASVDPSYQHLVLSFDFLALPLGPVAPPEYGGFAGVSADTTGLDTVWLAGTYLPALTVPPPLGTVLATDGQWHHYTIDFTEYAAANNLTALRVALEDWFGGGSVPGDVFFDNVKLTAKLDPSVIEQLVPCDGPSTGGTWKNHGAYVSTMSKVTTMLLNSGLITEEERGGYVSAAARSECGR